MTDMRISAFTEKILGNGAVTGGGHATKRKASPSTVKNLAAGA